MEGHPLLGQAEGLLKLLEEHLLLLLLQAGPDKLQGALAG